MRSACCAAGGDCTWAAVESGDACAGLLCLGAGPVSGWAVRSSANRTCLLVGARLIEPGGMMLASCLSTSDAYVANDEAGTVVRLTSRAGVFVTVTTGSALTAGCDARAGIFSMKSLPSGRAVWRMMMSPDMP